MTLCTFVKVVVGDREMSKWMMGRVVVFGTYEEQQIRELGNRSLCFDLARMHMLFSARS